MKLAIKAGRLGWESLLYIVMSTCGKHVMALY